jgi:hypothetical protein
MKNFFFTISFLFLTFLSFGQVNPSNHKVGGYTKSNGTYVQPYQRTNPNQTKKDNYSTYPNVNPNTGKQGTVKTQNYNSTYSYPSTTKKGGGNPY